MNRCGSYCVSYFDSFLLRTRGDSEWFSSCIQHDIINILFFLGISIWHPTLISYTQKTSTAKLYSCLPSSTAVGTFLPGAHRPIAADMHPDPPSRPRTRRPPVCPHNTGAWRGPPPSPHQITAFGYPGPPERAWATPTDKLEARVGEILNFRRDCDSSGCARAWRKCVYVT